MTIDATTDQALREQIAQAIHRASCSCEGHGDLPSWYREAADAVLPIVQAHDQALRDELRMAERQRDDARAAGGVYQKQYRKRCAALSSLRDAVAQLADEYAQTSALEGTLHPAALSAYEHAAHRLRSLLPQEGPK